MQAYRWTAERVLRELNSAPGGLSRKQAAARLAKHGENRLARKKGDSLWRRFMLQLSDPMILVLLAAAAVSAVLCVVHREFPADVLIIMTVVTVNAVLGVVQESKAEAAIEALQTMTAAKCKVLRGGHQMTVENSQLVPGDVVVLEAGDAVPADGRLLESASMKIEEAALTGESVPVTKAVELLTGDNVPLGDRKNMCYMGSTVVYGRGKAVVTATGMDTEMGKIAGVLAQTVQEETPLQRKLNELGKTLSKLVLGICIFSGGGRYPGGTCHGGDGGAEHWRDQYEQAPRRHTAADRRGDAGLHPGHLLRQDRHADTEQDDGGGAHGPHGAAVHRHGPVQRRSVGGGRRGRRAHRGGVGELRRRQRAGQGTAGRAAAPVRGGSL